MRLERGENRSGRCPAILIMRIILNDSIDPAFNLAAEEYLLCRRRENVIMLWRNDRSVIIGRNQNAVAEIDGDFVRENGIAVIRRMTGGGAVFHDLGNVNFTFISDYKTGAFNDYKGFTQPVCDFLHTLGVKAELTGRNDLTIDGMKFSGNAQTVSGDKIMHHGTLMYSADLSSLAGALKPRPIKLQSKGIASVRSRVTNIANHLAEELSVEEFLNALYRFFLERVEGVEAHGFSEEERRGIERLVAEKYGKWEWNIGSSPAFTMEKAEKYPFGLVEVGLDVADGVIRKIRIQGDFFGKKEIGVLCETLTGCYHKEEDLLMRLSKVEIGEYISGMTEELFVSLIL